MAQSCANLNAKIILGACAFFDMFLVLISITSKKPSLTTIISAVSSYFSSKRSSKVHFPVATLPLFNKNITLGELNKFCLALTPIISAFIVYKSIRYFYCL